MLRNPWETETRCKWTEEIIAQSMCRRITVKDESVSRSVLSTETRDTRRKKCQGAVI